MARFVFEITDKVKYDADNRILVKVNNALQQDVMPLVGDFNFYGGIYRDVNLIITDPVNISLTDYASPGVYLIQNKVTKEQAEVKAKVLVSNGSGEGATRKSGHQDLGGRQACPTAGYKSHGGCQRLGYDRNGSDYPNPPSVEWPQRSVHV